ncbi:MAG: ribosome maturation factor RimP [Christensenellales bacterium]
MNKEKIEKDVKLLTEPIVTNLGYELVDCTYEEIEGERYITLIIFSENGITFDDCKKVSKAVDEPLDELNPTDDLSYSLNVSSLGLDRPLKVKRDFERYLNKEIEVNCDGTKIVGIILEVLDDSIKLKIKNTTKTIKYEQIMKAMPYIKF